MKIVCLTEPLQAISQIHLIVSNEVRDTYHILFFSSNDKIEYIDIYNIAQLNVTIMYFLSKLMFWLYGVPKYFLWKPG